MNKPLKLNDSFLTSEHAFLYAVSQITIDTIYSEIEYDKLFLNINKLDKEIQNLISSIIKEMKREYEIYKKECKNLLNENIYTKGFDTCTKDFDIEEILYERVEDILLTQKTQVIKDQKIRTKMSVTNLLLLKILETVRAEGYKLQLSSKKIYALNTFKINDDLYEYCFKSQEYEYRIEQNTIEKKYLEIKEKEKRREKNLIKKLASTFKHITDEIDGLLLDIRRIDKTIYQELNPPIIDNPDIDLNKDLDIDALEKIDYEDDQEPNDMEDLPSDTSTPFIVIEKIDIKVLEDKKKEHEEEIKELELSLKLKKQETKIKVQKLSLDRTKNIKKARQELLKKCVTYENKIKINKQKKDRFFTRSFTDEITETDFTSQWSEKLVIPPRRSTAKIKKAIKKSCILPPKIIDKEKTDEEIEAAERKKQTDLIFRSLQYLESCGVLNKESIANTKFNNYQLNLNRSQEHPISAAFNLENILPLLISYLKFNHDHTLDKFLAHIDGLIDLTLKDPKSFSDTSILEYIVLEAYHPYHPKKLTILMKDTDTDKDKDKKVDKFEHISKYLLLYDNSMQKILSITDKKVKKRTLP